MKKKIIFVCTGNTCRSPMAEGFFRAALESDKELGAAYSAASAGLAAYEGESASSNAVQALKEGWSIDISSHNTSSLTGEAIREAFLVLTMKQDHKHSILSRYPEAGRKVYTLKECAYGTLSNMDNNSGSDMDSNFSIDHSTAGNSRNIDISDPFCGSLEVYKACAKEIKQAVDALIDKLKKS